MEILRWQGLSTGDEPDGPHAIALAADGSLVRARSETGQLLVSRTANPGAGSDFHSWTTLGACVPGSAVALAAFAGEILLASVSADGPTIVVRQSLDNGESWSAAVAIVAEASAIGPLALTLNPEGDACLFYTLGTSPGLKRLRRTAGIWSVSGTAWSRTADVASISGIAACHDGADFALLVSGAEATTGEPRCWAVRMGDLGLPTNAWSALVTVAEADAASAVTFAGPAIAAIAGQLRGAFIQCDASPVAARVMETRPMADAGDSGWWSDPAPHEASATAGFALASGDGAAAWAATPSTAWRAERPADLGLDDRLTACRYVIGPRSARLRLELDDPAGTLLGEPALAPGGTVTVRPGYQSGAGGGAEFGVSLEFTIERLATRTAHGRRVVEVDASGPWELARTSHASRAWQSPAGSLTRGQLFLRAAAHAGLFAEEASGARQPLGEWASDRPAFSLAPGETAASALERLLAPSPSRSSRTRACS